MKIDNNTYLILGLSITGYAVGYMVGGSATPVVSVAIPLVFGLIVSSFGLLQPYKQINTLPDNITNNADLVREIIDKIEVRAIHTKKYIGLALIFFSSFYLFGTLIGSNMRINEWLVIKQDQTLPWEESVKPNNINDAVNWILLDYKLKNLGFTNKDVKSLYEIQIAEWERVGKDKNSKKEGISQLKSDISELRKYIDEKLTQNKVAASTSSATSTTKTASFDLSSILKSFPPPKSKQPSTAPFENRIPYYNWREPSKNQFDSDTYPATSYQKATELILQKYYDN